MLRLEDLSKGGVPENEHQWEIGIAYRAVWKLDQLALSPRGQKLNRHE